MTFLTAVIVGSLVGLAIKVAVTGGHPERWGRGQRR